MLGPWGVRELQKQMEANYYAHIRLIGISDFGQHLGARVTQPHGRNIAHNDKRIVITVLLTITDGSLQNIREALSRTLWAVSRSCTTASEHRQSHSLSS